MDILLAEDESVDEEALRRLTRQSFTRRSLLPRTTNLKRASSLRDAIAQLDDAAFERVLLVSGLPVDVKEIAVEAIRHGPQYDIVKGDSTGDTLRSRTS